MEGILHFKYKEKLKLQHPLNSVSAMIRYGKIIQIS